jgi:N-acetylmuramoyl-L-alanine amidase
MHAQSVPHMSFNRSAPIVHNRPSTTFTPLVTRSRSFVQPQRTTPSIAFGGQAINNNAAVNAQNARSFAAANPSTQAAVRGGNTRDWRAPTELSRGWDRSRVHEWNHHHYRFYGGDWVVIDPGYPYDYGYPYGSYYGDEPAPYSAPAYDSSASLAMSVQDQLTRLGYSPGAIDGVIGPQTRDAIADFQSDHRLPVTGQIDTPLVQALGLQ